METFDQANFTMALAASLGVEAADISLDVSAASILVVATILVTNATNPTPDPDPTPTPTPNPNPCRPLVEKPQPLTATPTPNP